MKRKIFTLLAAFLALAAFHTNAQQPYDGTTPFVLNGFNRVSGSAFADCYYSGPNADFTVGSLNSNNLSGALTLEAGTIVYKSPEGGKFGNLNDYFYIKNVKNPLDNSYKLNVFEIYAYSTNQKLSYTLGDSTYTAWEVVRFTNTANSNSYDIMDGGFLAPQQGSSATLDGRLLLVRGLADNKLYLKTYKEYSLNTTKYWPVYIRAEKMGARWAQQGDFVDFPDFIRIPDKYNGGNLTVQGACNFKIMKVAHYELSNPAIGLGPDVLSDEGTGTKKFIELFSFAAPEYDNKLISIAKNRNVLKTEGPSTNNVYGDSLILLNPLEENFSDPSGVSYKAQRFAIWLEIDGTMTLYPYSAYTYIYGSPGLSIEKDNSSILGNITSISNSNLDSYNYFKIGRHKATGSYVVGPTKYAGQTLFDSAGFVMRDVTMYNKIPQKRYFYLQTKIAAKDVVPGYVDNDTLVLDVVRQYDSNNNIQKKIVLTTKEKGMRKTQAEQDYYNLPYDSVNLSAYWSFEPVYAKTFNATEGGDKIIGYKIMNELGDVLQYTDNGVLGIVTDESHAYLDPTVGGQVPSAYSAVLDAVKAYVWKSLSLPIDCSDANIGVPKNSFYLTNIGGAVVYDATTGVRVTKNLKNIRGWDVSVDLAKGSKFTTQISEYYYGTISSSSPTFYHEVDHRKSYYPISSSVNYLNGEGQYFTFRENTGGSLQRNTGYYDPAVGRSVATHGLNAYNPTTYTNGLELKLIPVDYAPYLRTDNPGKNTNRVVRHDSINPYSKVQEWGNYQVDSLWNYMYEKPGVYTIAEVYNHKDGIKRSHLNGVAYLEHMISSDDIIIEPVEILISNRLQGTDKRSDVYKWYYLKDRETGLYMTMNDNWPNLQNQLTGKYGFSFTETLKQNAAIIRYYQPLVDDKANQYFIIETVAPQYYYTNDLQDLGGGNYEYRLDNSRGSTGSRNYTYNGAPINGKTYYAALVEGSDLLTIVESATRATRWDFTTQKELGQCREDYIDNDFLADTRMYGAPLTAERWYQGKLYQRYITTNAFEKSVDKYVAPETQATFVLVPAAVIKPLGNGTGTIADKFYDATGKQTSGGYTGTFDFGTETRPVQLYYIKKIEKNKKPQFLTVTSENVYWQDLDPQMSRTVSGDVLEFQDAKAYTTANQESMLQMFAIYGLLGTDVNKNPLDKCIATDSAFHYGQFVIVPSAAWEVDVKNPAAAKILKQNSNIGNSTASDEFKVGMVYSTDTKDPKYKYNYKLIVTPGGVEGYAISEYVFSYKPFIKDFNCLNYITSYGSDSTVYYASNGWVNPRHTSADSLDKYTGYRYNNLGVAVSDKSFHGKDYADPSQHWGVTRVNKTGTSLTNADYYAYMFAPSAQQTRTQAKAPQTLFKDNRYMYLIEETEDKTARGDVGYLRSVIAAKQYKKDPITNKYIFSENFNNDIATITIDEITNKYVSADVDTTVDAKTRRYNGDSAVDYFYKFKDGEVVSFDWAIIETVYKDRYMWATKFDKYPRVDSMQAYIDTIKARYLTLKISKVDTIAKCENTVIHYIPYYNIVYTDVNTARQYYLDLDQNGNATFVYMTIAEQRELAEKKNDDSFRPGMKFCFPYKMEKYDRIQYVGEGYDEDPNKDNSPSTNPFYWDGKVFIQSMANFYANGDIKTKPSLVKVTGSSVILEGNVQPSLYGIDYTTDLDATTWFFGDNGASDNVWVRLAQVPEDTKAYLRDTNNSDENFVTKGSTVDNGIVYAQLNYKLDIPNLKDGGGKLTFHFVDSAILGTYDKKPIWYYYIINEEGQYLTSAGFKPGGTKPSNDYIWPGHGSDPNGEGYAYFRNKMTTDAKYQQLFGLKWKKAEEGEHELYRFWVVAGVDSLGENYYNSDYYYLSGNNDRLVFRYGGGTSKVATEGSALIFEIGVVNPTDSVYTDIDNSNVDGLVVVGGQGNVKVTNATGMVDLYSVDGRLFKSVEATGSEMTIQAPKGVMIVKNRAQIVKVIVK